MAYWWNWDTMILTDMESFSPDQKKRALDTFVPMLWGQAPPSTYNWSEAASELMLFNEPDNYAPACCGVAGDGCAAGDYRPADSDGWYPVFDPSIHGIDPSRPEPHGAQWVAWSINNATLQPNRPSDSHAIRLVSPSMANGAKATNGSCVGVDPSLPGNPKDCQGWLSQFKAFALQLQCTDYSGKSTNCWDVLDAIQIHAYSHYASAVVSKIDDYYQEFEEDFLGTNGRSKKTLWLTEVAAATNNATKVVSFIDELMTTLKGSSKYDFVERVSWFSEYSFGAFEVDGIVPQPREQWASSLFNPFGNLSIVGDAFFGHCG